MIAITLTGCTGSSQHKVTEVAEIHYQVLFQEGFAKDPLGKRYVDAVTDFNLANPNIKVVIDYLPPDFQDYMKLMKSEHAPDVIPWSTNELQSAVDNNLLRDLSSLSIKELDIPQTILNSGTINGELLVLPYGSQPSGVFYNKEMFDAAKVPYPEGDWTWDQYRDISEKIMGTPSVLPYTIYTLEMLLLSVGSSVLAPDGSTSQGYLDSADAVRMIQWLNSYYRDTASTRASTDGFDPFNQFAKQQTGMYLGNLGSHFYNFEGAGKSKLGVAPLPYFEGGERVNPTGISGYGITKSSEHPEAAWTFIQYLTMENNAHSIELAQDYLPTSKAMAEAVHVDDDPIVSVFNKELPYAGHFSFVNNVSFYEAWNAKLMELFVKLQEADDDQIASNLHDIAQQFDQELNRLQQDKLTKSEAEIQ
jgi:multiple sugar transport system substrate-binding protein